MPRFCLDTSALLTLRDNEPGADRVAQLLEAPVRCVACFITRMEVLYRVWKDEGERAGRLAGVTPFRWTVIRASIRVLVNGHSVTLG
jgi:predicted nucleic acid-binding protein